ncbi:MAG: hypothetical protein RL251_864, partial [Pseudomonadota bacterium]
EAGTLLRQIPVNSYFIAILQRKCVFITTQHIALSALSCGLLKSLLCDGGFARYRVIYV